MNIFKGVIDLIFPKICFSCGQQLSQSQAVICSECEQSLHFLETVCEKCGNPENPENCKVCSLTNFYFDRAISLFLFNEKLQKLIHEFKYNEVKQIGKYFGTKTEEYLTSFTPFREIDMIVPVPLHAVRKRSRGFNQSEVLTKEISERMNWKHIPKLILRKQFTQTQTKLNRNERRTNVANAFIINKKYDVKKKNILLVDDVFTTGSTANSICKLLKENMAGKVYVLTIARAK